MNFEDRHIYTDADNLEWIFFEQREVNDIFDLPAYMIPSNDINDKSLIKVHCTYNLDNFFYPLIDYYYTQYIKRDRVRLLNDERYEDWINTLAITQF